MKKRETFNTNIPKRPTFYLFSVYAIIFTFTLILGFSTSTAFGAPRLSKPIKMDLPYLVELYKHLHAHPELSRQEKETSKRMAKELEKAGFSVTQNIGGYGVVGVLENGHGPTVMLRTDMDGLPVKEETELAYASKVKAIDADGKETYVMHACSHDVHMTTFIGAARLLSGMKEHWSGTLLMVAQPAEEIVTGAKAMIDDGLFTRFPRPDYMIGLHAFPMQIGMVAYREGYSFASAATVHVKVKGIGGHGANPHLAKDPIVMAAQMILDFQTIVSREINPLEPAVITVGSIHGGTVENVIAEEVLLKLTLRAYPEKIRSKMIEAVKRKALAVANANNMPEDRLPEVTVVSECPAVNNDPKLTIRLIKAIRGKAGKYRMSKTTGAEDFAFYGMVEPKIPSAFFGIGIYTGKKINELKAKGQSVPSNHNPGFATDNPEKTFKSSVKVLGLFALDLMKKTE